jgi:hypothetical protein
MSTPGVVVIAEVHADSIGVTAKSYDGSREAPRGTPLMRRITSGDGSVLGHCGGTAAWRWKSRRNAEPLRVRKRRNDEVDQDNGLRVLRRVGLVMLVLECRADDTPVVVVYSNMKMT